MPKQLTIGSEHDIRVLQTGLADSPDAGLVEGTPIDPPDERPGWQMVNLWVEHDTVQEKGEKGVLVTRKTNPVYHQVWVRLKTKGKKANGKRRGRPPAAPAPAAPAQEAPKASTKPSGRKTRSTRALSKARTALENKKNEASEASGESTESTSSAE